MVELTEQDMANVGPRDTKEPGSPTWCWQTVSLLQNMWASLDLGEARYEEVWQQADANRIWEKIPEDNPFGTKEEMLKQLEVGDYQQARRRLSLQPVARQVRRKFEHGGDRRSEDFQVDKYQLENQGGTSRDYLLARLYHQHYDIFERWERGEFRSIQAAAREAGLGVQKARRTVTLGNNIDRLATALHGHFTPDQFTELSRRMLQLRRQGKQGDSSGT